MRTTGIPTHRAHIFTRIKSIHHDTMSTPIPDPLPHPYNAMTTTRFEYRGVVCCVVRNDMMWKDWGECNLPMVWWKFYVAWPRDPSHGTEYYANDFKGKNWVDKLKYVGWDNGGQKNPKIDHDIGWAKKQCEDRIDALLSLSLKGKKN